jgi:hypothetical protein
LVATRPGSASREHEPMPLLSQRCPVAASRGGKRRLGGVDARLQCLLVNLSFQFIEQVVSRHLAVVDQMTITSRVDRRHDLFQTGFDPLPHPPLQFIRIRHRQSLNRFHGIHSFLGFRAQFQLRISTPGSFGRPP